MYDPRIQLSTGTFEPAVPMEPAPSTSIYNVDLNWLLLVGGVPEFAEQTGEGSYTASIPVIPYRLNVESTGRLDAAVPPDAILAGNSVVNFD
jgi:hypothetical protein